MKPRQRARDKGGDKGKGQCHVRFYLTLQCQCLAHRLKPRSSQRPEVYMTRPLPALPHTTFCSDPGSFRPNHRSPIPFLPTPSCPHLDFRTGCSLCLGCCSLLTLQVSAQIPPCPAHPHLAWRPTALPSLLLHLSFLLLNLLPNTSPPSGRACLCICFLVDRLPPVGHKFSKRPDFIDFPLVTPVLGAGRTLNR